MRQVLPCEKLVFGQLQNLEAVGDGLGEAHHVEFVAVVDDDAVVVARAEVPRNIDMASGSSGLNGERRSGESLPPL